MTQGAVLVSTESRIKSMLDAINLAKLSIARVMILCPNELNKMWTVFFYFPLRRGVSRNREMVKREGGGAFPGCRC